MVAFHLSEPRLLPLDLRSTWLWLVVRFVELVVVSGARSWGGLRVSDRLPVLLGVGPTYLPTRTWAGLPAAAV